MTRPGWAATAAAYATAWVTATLLAACGSAAPPRLHSLQGEPLRVGPPLLAWRLAPVAVPAQVDQPQFVLRRADGSLAVLEHDRWQAPLQDQLQDALAEQLAARLGPAGRAPASGRADWRITLDVQRFDSTLGQATLVARWRVQSAALPAGLACTVHLEQAASGGVSALPGAHRRNLQQLAEGLAPVLKHLDAGLKPPCPA
jgi:uncharacterized protein